MSAVTYPAARTRSMLPTGLALFSFLLSLVLLPFYHSGDQIHYRHFYEIVSDLGPIEAFIYYVGALGSREPGYFLVVYLFSGFMNKDLLMALLNGAFGYFLGRHLTTLRVSPYVVALLAFNFYLWVVYLPAERLKLALLLVLMAAAYRGLPRQVWLGVAVITHVQTVLLIASRMMEITARALRPLLDARVRHSVLWVLAGGLVLLAIMFALREHIMLKLESYMALSGGVTHLAKPLAFTALAWFYAPGRRMSALAMQLPLIVAAFIVGGERVVIFSYFVFLYFGLQYRRGMNAGVLVTSAYFFIRGFVFIGNVITYGDGFPGESFHRPQ